jgi:NodT family efflux transporter outer membrane factor (OMF) lipoprotein
MSPLLSRNAPATLVLALVLSACASRSADDASATPNVPQAFTEAAGAPRAQLDAGLWYASYGDPLFAELVERAGTATDDVAIASARLDRARAGLAGARSVLAPRLDVAGSASTRDQGDLDTQSSVQLGLSAIWDLDLFGQARTRARGADARAQAAAFSVEASRIATRGAAAQLYVAIREAQTRKRAADDTVAAFADTLAIATERNRAGLASGLDPAQARSALEAARAQPARFAQAESIARLSLEELLGYNPGDLKQRLDASAPELSSPELGSVLRSPAEVVGARPDLMAAELLLSASGFDATAARRDLLPRISLNAFFGGINVDPETPFSGSGSLLSAGANIVAPLINFGQLQSAVDAADASRRESAIVYRQSVRRAVSEVERALVSLSQSQARSERLTQAVAAARDEAGLARARYTSGLTTFLDVLQAERNVYAASDALADAKGDVTSASIALATALAL